MSQTTNSLSLFVFIYKILFALTSVWCHTAIASQGLSVFPFRGASISEA
jgi:hypothetical protein